MSRAYSKELLAEMWEKMVLSRKFEEKVEWLFSRGLVHGTTHLGIGEEATAVGSVLALKSNDYVFGTHRGHSQALAKGIDVNAMMAEILAKETGVCRGKGGSMHIADPSIYYYGADGVLGASAVIACGTALAIKKKKEKDRIATVFFGDGTANEGAVFEAMNLAAVWCLPLLFICVNNTYGMSTHISKVMKNTDISLRGIPFDIPSENIDGNDVLAVYDSVSEARKYVLEKGPMLIVENTYRISGHSKSDGNHYRAKEEINSWKEKCPIKSFERYLIGQKNYTKQELDNIQEEISRQIESAVKFAEDSPEPVLDNILDDVYA